MVLQEVIGTPIWFSLCDTEPHQGSTFMHAFRAFLIAVTICSLPAFCQRGGAPSTGGPGRTGNSTGPTNTTGFPNSPSTPTGIPNPNSSIPSTNFPSMRDYFLYGKVILDDGAPPSPDIRIERVCNGRPHLETYTDAKGRFSIQLGAPNPDIDTDAADNGNPMPGRFNQSIGRGMSPGMGPYWNCELRAAYPGYTSDVLNLATLQPFDSQVGTIVLHRIGGVKASTISVTSALAPKRAQKDYEKAMDLIAKHKYEEAEKRLLAATAAYPKYAVAWYELGRLQARENRLDAARQSFQAAIAADSHYMSPYDQLAGIAAQQKRWEEAVKYSSEVISANPDAFPSSYWYNAVANYELKNTAAAEKSARELVKIDTLHEYPQAERMLAGLLLDKADYSDSAQHLRAYLNLVPNASDAAQLRQTLSKIEQAAAQSKTQTNATKQ